MTCSRNGCENVMCDRHSSIHGYICHECFDELVKMGPETNVRKFMESEKKESPYMNEEAAIARFNVEFPNCR